MGIKIVAIISAIVMCLIIVPAFKLLSTGSLNTAILGLSLFGIVMGFICTITPLLMVTLFPARIRYSASALAYNLAPAYYVAMVTVIGLLITINGFKLKYGSISPSAQLANS